MKWNEMTTARKILTVVENVSGILYWIFFLLYMLDILDITAVVLVLMLVNCACKVFTASSKALKIMWGILFVAVCLMSVVALLLYLR